jgi:hypothetical protein
MHGIIVIQRTQMLSSCDDGYNTRFLKQNLITFFPAEMGQQSVILRPYYACEAVPATSFDDSETGLLPYQYHPRGLRKRWSSGRRNQRPMIVLVKTAGDSSKGSVAQKDKRSLWFRLLSWRKLLISSSEDTSLSSSAPIIPSRARLGHLTLKRDVSLESTSMGSIQDPSNQSSWKPSWKETISLNSNERTNISQGDSIPPVSKAFSMNKSYDSSSLSSPDISISSVQAVAAYQNSEVSKADIENNHVGSFVFPHPSKEPTKADTPMITSKYMTSLEHNPSMDIESLLVRSQSLLNKHLYLQYEPLQSPEFSPKEKDIDHISSFSSKFKVMNQKVAFETSLSDPISDWSTPTSLWYHDILPKSLKDSYLDAHGIAFEEEDDMTKHILRRDDHISSHSYHGTNTHDWYNEIRGRDKIAQYLARQKKIGDSRPGYIEKRLERHLLKEETFFPDYLSSRGGKARTWDEDSSTIESHTTPSYRIPRKAFPNNGLLQIPSYHTAQGDNWKQLYHGRLLTRRLSEESETRKIFVRSVVRSELASGIPIARAASEDGLLSIDSEKQFSQFTTPVISNRYDQHLQFMKSRVNGTKQIR